MLWVNMSPLFNLFTGLCSCAANNCPLVSHRFRAKRRRALGLGETVPDKDSAAATIDSSPGEGREAESKEESKGQEEDGERKQETKTEEGKEQEGESKDRGDVESDSSSEKASKVPRDIKVQDEQQTASFGLGK